VLEWPECERSSRSSSSGVLCSPVLPGVESLYNNNRIDTPLSPAFLEILANPKILLRRRTSSKKETIFEFNQLS